MKPDITKRLDNFLVNKKAELLTTGSTSNLITFDKSNFDRKEIKYLNKKAEEMGLTIYWYDTTEDE
jgi:hypothetical protein